MTTLDFLPRNEFTRIRNNWPSGNTLLDRITHFSGPPTDTGCVEWIGTKTGKGRPILVIDGKGRKALVSRLVWIWHKGRIPPGKIIRHVVCRNIACVNVDHLAVGTHLDNSKDRDNDGTTARGANHYAAILTEAQVQDILLWKESHRSAARRYGVGVTTIFNIRSGKNWAHIPRPTK